MAILSRYNAEYRASLKDPRAEELLDLWIFRPIAFLLARVLVRTPVTPNQITFAAIVSALVAGVSLATGTRDGMIAGALFYALSNVLDCADGMVARIKRNGTPLGRMVDVFADSVSGAMVYIGLGIGLGSWPLVILSGMSFALQAALFDRVRNRFLSQGAGVSAGSIDRELAVAASAVQRERSLARRVLAALYVRYMGWQQRASREPVDARTLRLWSLIGSTTHVTVVVVALLANAPEVIYVYAIGIANVWMAIVGGDRGDRRDRGDGRVRDGRDGRDWRDGRDGGKSYGSDGRDVGVGDVVAVVLAAGSGSRLRPLTDEVPKPLVEVAGVALLARALDALVEAGVKRFVVIAGYRAASVARFLDREYPELDVEIIYNQRYDVSNNAASVACAARSLEGRRLLLVDGDLLFDPSIVEEIVSGDARRSRLVVRRTDDLGEEEMKVELDARGRIARIAKTLDPATSAGESMGIALFDERATARLFATLERRLGEPGGDGEFYEAAFQEMIDGGVELGVVETRGRVCVEIDTIEDLEEAEGLVPA